MKFFKIIINFYINSSIHVALSCYVLVCMTQLMFHIKDQNSVSYFAFFGTIVGYNFVKYDALARVKKLKMRKELKAIALLSFIALLFSIYLFIKLETVTQILGICLFILTLLYALPFFPNQKNARNWKGIKIYIVALCWVGVTLVLPIINSGIQITSDFYLKCIQRFLLIFVLILIFEIIDLKQDDVNLKTVPQQIGVRRTKFLGLFLLFVFYCFEFLKIKTEQIQLIINFIIVLTIALFLIFSNEKKSKYYSAFWVEAIPVFWFLLLLFFRQFF